MLFVLYLGHAIMKDGRIHCVDHNGNERYNLEGFVQTCARLPNIFAISIYACCRRDRTGIGARNSAVQYSTTDMITIYRDEISEYSATQCSCDPW